MGALVPPMALWCTEEAVNLKHVPFWGVNQHTSHKDLSPGPAPSGTPLHPLCTIVGLRNNCNV